MIENQSRARSPSESVADNDKASGHDVRQRLLFLRTACHEKADEKEKAGNELSEIAPRCLPKGHSFGLGVDPRCGSSSPRGSRHSDGRA